jgi:hypothetical protein
MPAEDGRGLNEKDIGPPVLPDLTEPSPEGLIGCGEFRTFDRALQNPDLVAQGEDL